MRRLARGLMFVFSAALAMAACHFSVDKLGLNPPTPRPPFEWTPGQYLAHYDRYGLDFILLRHNVFGLADPIINADVICYSSSKGLFGFDAAYLSQRLSQPGHPVRVYNLSFPFGESFAYLVEVIKTLDLHDKLLLADVTDNTAHYDLSSMGTEALRTTNRADAYKLALERSLIFAHDWLLTGLVPHLAFDRQHGFVATPQFAIDTVLRSVATGDYTNMISGEGEAANYPKAAHYSFDFSYSALEKPFFEECRRRNIRIVFTSIPYSGYDPEFGSRVARTLGLPYAGVDPSGIRVAPDGVHLRAIGRQQFCKRLADQLLSPRIDIRERVAQVRRHPQAIDSIAVASRGSSRPGGTHGSGGEVLPVSYDAPLTNRLQDSPAKPSLAAPPPRELPTSVQARPLVK